MKITCSFTLINKWIKDFFITRLPVRRKRVIANNLKANWFFPISALAFFGMSLSNTLDCYIGLIISVFLSIVISSQISSITIYMKHNNIWFHIIAFLSAFGICWNGQTVFYKRWIISPNAKKIEEMLPTKFDFAMVISVCSAIIAIIFVYFYILIFWNRIIKIFSRLNLLMDITTIEWIVYCSLIIISFIYISSAYLQTEAFYGTKHDFDIIYTSDSPCIVKNNAYMTLMHSENDIRQPLFAVFSAPFIGIPFLIGKLFNVPASIQAILMNSVQIIMMFVANFLLARTIKLTSNSRICFMVLISNTYTYLLFALMMEQYIIAYFWLAICVYLITEKNYLNRLALWGAGGSLLTSLILLPFLSKKNPFKCFKAWILNLISYGLEFVFIMLAFGRFETFNLFSKRHLLNFTGQHVTTIDKLKQYTAFIKNYFFAPDAGINISFTNHVSWQLNPIKDINIIGVVILTLSFVSAYMNRKKQSSRFAVSWVALSVVILFILGWGTSENGLILYELYFGWAFLVLLVQLVELIEATLKINFLVPLTCIGFALIFAAVNIPAVMKMITFAITYYPT